MDGQCFDALHVYEYVPLFSCLCVVIDSRDEALEAFAKFNGRWYAGRQLSCRLSCVTRWKMAICGEYWLAACYLVETASVQGRQISSVVRSV